MPSKKPIFPLRLEPELKASAEKHVTETNGLTLNGWITELIQEALAKRRSDRPRTTTTTTKLQEKPKAPPRAKPKPNRAQRRALAKFQRMAAKDEAHDKRKSTKQG